MVWLSADFAARSAASVLDAPGLFSTTTVCLSMGPSLSATARAMAAVPPPGADPTSRRSGLVGQSAGCAWACAGPGPMTDRHRAPAAIAANTRIFMVVSLMNSLPLTGNLL
ncbi:hypothetical protein G6F57_023377 [Rhizopus arrhizus]|nr:hypothetical protein G6F57_023377 [Rhizopus arrhizus]